MRLIDADKLLRHIERADENELENDVITIIQDMPSENLEELTGGAYEIDVYAFCDKLKARLEEEMTKSEIIALIDDILG